MPGVRVEKAGFKTLLETILATVQGVSGISSLDAFALFEGKADVERDFGITMYVNGELATPAQITDPGLVEVRRIRSGFDTQIVAPTTSSKALGKVYYTYNFPSASWDLGDIFYFIFTGVEVGGNPVPTKVVWGRIVANYDPTLLTQDVLNVVEHVEYGNAALESLLSSIIGSMVSLDEAIDGARGVIDEIRSLLVDAEDGIPAVLGAIAALSLQEGNNTTLINDNITSLTLLINAVRSRTDNLPINPAAVGSAMTLQDNSITGSKLHSSAITAIQSGLATSSQVAGLNNVSQTDILNQSKGAINTSIGAGFVPNSKSLIDILHKNSSYTWSKGSHSLEAIGDKVGEIQGPSQTYTIEDIRNILVADRPNRVGGSLVLTSSYQNVLDRMGGNSYFSTVGRPRKVRGFLDLSSAASNAVIWVKVSIVLKSGGTARVIENSFAGTGADKIIPIPALFPVGDTSFKVLLNDLVNMYGLKIEARQSAGSYITMDYELYESE